MPRPTVDLTTLYEEAVRLHGEKRLPTARERTGELRRALGPLRLAQSEDVASVLLLDAQIDGDSGNLPRAGRTLLRLAALLDGAVGAEIAALQAATANALRQGNVGAAGVCARLSPSPGVPIRGLDTGETSSASYPLASRSFDDVGSHSHHSLLSGLHHAARTLAVYASRPRSPVYCIRPRKTRFRLVAHLGRTGLVTARSPEQGPVVSFQH